MNYEAAVRYLLSLGRELAAPTQAAAAKFDLENIAVLAERLGQPQRAYPSAHIAGTNGKGSTAAFLESILRHAGFRTGLNTSPHLEKINERIRINGAEISDQAFAESFTRLHERIEELLAAGKLALTPLISNASRPWPSNILPASECSSPSSKSAWAAASMPPTSFHHSSPSSRVLISTTKTSSAIPSRKSPAKKPES